MLKNYSIEQFHWKVFEQIWTVHQWTVAMWFVSSNSQVVWTGEDSNPWVYTYLDKSMSTIFSAYQELHFSSCWTRMWERLFHAPGAKAIFNPTLNGPTQKCVVGKRPWGTTWRCPRVNNFSKWGLSIAGSNGGFKVGPCPHCKLLEYVVLYFLEKNLPSVFKFQSETFFFFFKQTHVNPKNLKVKKLKRYLSKLQGLAYTKLLWFFIFFERHIYYMIITKAYHRVKMMSCTCCF